VFSVSSPSIIDTEATEDKKYGYDDEKKYGYEDEKKYGYEDEKKYGYEDEKKYGYEDEKKYGYDDKDKRYAYAEEKKYERDGGDKKYGYEEEKKYGNENKYGYEEDNKYEDDKKIVKYVSCQNINISGKKSFQHGEERPNHMKAYGEENSYGGSSYGGSSYGGSSYGEEISYGEENSYMNHNSKPDYVKETHKDVTVICIQKNQNQNKTVPEPVVECEDCFKVRPLGFLPPGQLNHIEDFLTENAMRLGFATIEELCDAIENEDITEQQLLRLINAALPGEQPRLVQKLFDCLSAFFPIL
jgi:hypothetical protein